MFIYFAEYNRLLTGTRGNHIEAEQTKRLEALVKSNKRKACLKQARKNKAVPTISHAILGQEIQYVQKKLEVFLETGRRVKKRKDGSSQGAKGSYRRGLLLLF
jgi:hypothetical protein